MADPRIERNDIQRDIIERLFPCSYERAREEASAAGIEFTERQFKSRIRERRREKEREAWRQRRDQLHECVRPVVAEILRNQEEVLRSAVSEVLSNALASENPLYQAVESLLIGHKKLERLRSLFDTYDDSCDLLLLTENVIDLQKQVADAAAPKVADRYASSAGTPEARKPGRRRPQ